MNKKTGNVMGSIQLKLRWLLSAILLLQLFLPVAANDRLTTPAVKTVRASQALLLDITAAGQQLIAVGDQGVVLRSSDEGLSWQQIQTPFSVMLTSTFFTDEQRGWVVGHDGLMASTNDAGLSWQTGLDGNQINHLRLERLQELLLEAESLSDADPDNEALLERLDLLSWQVDDAQVAQEEGPSVPLLDILFTSPQRGYLLGGYGLLLRTDDGGQSWQYWGDRLENPDSFHLNAMTVDHRGFLYIAGEAGLLFRSVDDGVSWETLDSPYEGSFFAVTEFDQQLLLMGLRGHLYRSEDGLDWVAVETGSGATLNGAYSSQDKVLLLGAGGTVLQSSDGLRFKRLDSGGRSSLSAAVITGHKTVLVGEQGVVMLEANDE